jgi:glycosyltransferase involved in cell wall biosynthesis
MRFLWEQIILPWQALIYKLDVIHSLGYISPLLLHCISIVTIHDLNFIFIPEGFSRFTRWIQKFFVTQSARRTDYIIADSEFIRSQIIEILNIPKNKVLAIHLAPTQRALSNKDIVWDDICKQLSIAQPYLLAFSSFSPHKNIHGLLKAYAQIKNQKRINAQLVIIGHLPKEGTFLSSLTQELCLNGNEVVFSGYLPDDFVSMLLSQADLYVHPSFYEGFGFPILEAMEVGTPVACSNRGSLPEVAGDAAVYFDPSNIREMAAVISFVMESDKKRQELNEKGFINLQRFSWKETARRTLELYTGNFVGD